MRFKLDENMPTAVKELLCSKGHEVHTVFDESLNGKSDQKVADACRQEQRILITLDRDFSNIRVFPPDDLYGIILLRPHLQSEPQIIRLMDTVLPFLETESVEKTLWTVEPSGIRIR